jgi:hypothetical protein
MKNIYRFFILGMLSSLLNAQELQSCSEISDSKARLECYDKSIKMSKPKQDTDNKFGLSKAMQTKKSPPTEIVTNIVGPFRGWKSGQVLTLENGQEWKVISRTSGYVKLESPQIKIIEGVWGSFDIKVEGFNVQGKVRRIK